MKTPIIFLALFLSLQTFSQSIVKTTNSKTNLSTVTQNYLSAIGANNLDSINSIKTVYKAKTAMGEFIDVKIFTKTKFTETLSMSGNVLLSLGLTKDEVYQMSNGKKIVLPKSLHNDFKILLGLFPEVNLNDTSKAKLEEVTINDEKCYSIEIPGQISTYKFIYSKKTGLKVKEVTLTKGNNTVNKSEYKFKDYESFSGIKFPKNMTISNFMSTGVNAEFILEDVEFNAEEKE